MAVGQRMRISRRGMLAPPSPVRKLAPLATSAVQRGVKVHHVNIGQPDLPAPEPVLAAIRGYSDPLLPYAPSRGCPETVEAWAIYYRTQGYSVDADQLVVTTGGSEALSFAFMAVADPGEDILVFEPTYANYFGFAVASGLDMHPVTTHSDDGFHLPDRHVIEEQIGASTRAICIANPNNPTGTAYDRSELEMLVDLALQHDLFLIADETYRELLFDGRIHAGLLSLDVPEVADHAIVVDSVSKRFSATGARVGCVVSRNGDVIDAVSRFAQARLSTATVEQLAVCAMLRSPRGYTTWLASVYQSRRDALLERLSRGGIECGRPDGAFYLMADLPVDDSDHFARWLLSEFQSDGETVMIAPGSGFYLTPGLGVRQARIAYVLNESDLARAADLLVQALATYPWSAA